MSDYKWYVIEKKVELPSSQKYHGLSRDSEYEKLTSEEGLGIVLAQAPMTPEEKFEVEKLHQVKKVYEGGYASIDVHPPLDYGKKDASLDLHRVKEAHQNGYKGKGSLVSIIDTGLDQRHHDGSLRGKVKALKDFTNSPSGHWDKQSHGTHVAGTVIDHEYGVAPDAQIIVAKALDDNGSGSYAGIIKAIEWSVLQGADVINMSLSGRASSDSPLSRAANVASDKGVIVVAAAGNGGNAESGADDNSPANAEHVITVAAVDTSGRIASFSDGGLCVDIAGMGVNEISLGLNGTRGSRMSGTSMASPHIAGICALLPDEAKKDKERSLYRSAKDTPYGQKRVGSGIADALAFVGEFQEEEPVEEPENPRIVPYPRPEEGPARVGYRSWFLYWRYVAEMRRQRIVRLREQLASLQKSVDPEEFDDAPLVPEEIGCGEEPSLSSLMKAVMKDYWDGKDEWKRCREREGHGTGFLGRFIK